MSSRSVSPVSDVRAGEALELVAAEAFSAISIDPALVEPLSGGRVLAIPAVKPHARNPGGGARAAASSERCRSR